MESIIEVESIKTNFATLIARVGVVQRTWNKIKKDIPKRPLESLTKLHSDIKDKHYNSAVALFDIIRFIQFGVKERSGCAEYYWTPEEKFGILPTGDIHADFYRSHCSHDYVKYQKQEIAKRLKQIRDKGCKNFEKHTLAHYSGVQVNSFILQLDSASVTLNTIHTALLKLLKDRYNSKLVEDLVEYSSRCCDTSEYRKKFHQSCYDEYKRYENTGIVTKPLQPKPSVAASKIRKKVISCSDEEEESKSHEEQTESHEDQTYCQIGDEVGRTAMVPDEEEESDNLGSHGEETNPQIGDEEPAKKKRRADLDVGVPERSVAKKKKRTDQMNHQEVTSCEFLKTGFDVIDSEEKTLESKLTHTTVIDLHLDDGPAVDMPEDTIVDSRVEKLEDGLYSNLKVQLENAKSDLVLSFKDMLSISISGSIETVAQLVPISSIDFTIKTKVLQPNQARTKEDALITVLKHTGSTASKYNELQTLILNALLNDPTSIRFGEHEYEYLSEGLISYCSQCKEFAKITMTSLVEKYPSDLDVDKLKTALYQSNQSIVKTLNGFVAYIMRDFVNGSIEKGEEFIEKHLNAVASCSFVYLEVGESRSNMEKIVHDKNKIKEVGDNILRKIQRLSSSAIGHQSNKSKIKDVLLAPPPSPPPPLLVTSATTIESSKQSHVVDDFEGDVNELISLCDKVQRAALTINNADSKILNLTSVESTDDVDSVSQKSRLLYIITAYAKSHIKDSKKKVYCFTNDVFKSLKLGEFFLDINLFQQKYGGDFEVHEENGDDGILDAEEFKLFNYPDDDDIDFFFPCI